MVTPLPRPSLRPPLLVYLDVAKDGADYRLGLYSPELGSCSRVLSEAPPNQQCAEALAFLWGPKLVYNVG